MKQKRDPFSTSVHMDLMHGENEKEQTVLTVLDFFDSCPGEQKNRKEILDSYNLTEEDVREYYPSWVRMRSMKL